MINFDFIFYFILVTVGYICGIYISYNRVLKRHGPDSNEIRKIKYNHGNKCYKFKPVIISCETG